MSKSPVELLQSYRRDQILKAARTVISERGYARSSVDMIARRAGVSRSTVYEYFSSKDEILKGCFAASREPLAYALLTRIQAVQGMEAQLAVFFEICLSQVDENKGFFQAIDFPIPLYSVTAVEGPGSTEFALVLKDFHEAVDGILDAGHQTREIGQPADPMDRDSLGTLIVGAMAARSRQEAPPPVATAASALARFAVRGLGVGRSDLS